MQPDHDLLAEVFPGKSQMSALMAAHDWTATSLGHPAQWPEALRIPLRMLLTSRFEMWLGWGPELAFFYNDAYIPTLGDKHGAALGRPVKEVWSEVYAAVEDRLDKVRAGTATWDQALMLLLERRGYKEETYHTFSYSPLMNGASVAGLFCVVTEETERVVSERWLATTQRIAAAMLSCRTRQAVVDNASVALASNQKDFPFAEVKLFDAGLTPQKISGAAQWDLAAARSGKTTVVDLGGIMPAPPCGAWDAAPRTARIIPIPNNDGESAYGALILGTNPYEARDRKTEELALLLASQIGTAIAAADAVSLESLEKERLHGLFEQSPSFMAVLRGPEHRFESANPRYRAIVGNRDLIGHTVRDALSELEGQGYFELLDSVYRTGEPFIGRAVPLNIGAGSNADGRMYLDFVYQPIRDASGEVTGIFVEGYDVTASQNATAALAKSEEDFRTLAEVMPNQAWTALPTGDLDWFNDRVYAFAGKTFKDLAGTGWASIVHPDDLPVAAERWSRSTTSGEPYEAQFRLKAKTDEYRWHIARAVPVRTETGAIARWIGTNTDIQDQKTTAESLTHLNATLEQQVTQRTDELMVAEAALRQSQKMEAVGQLTGGIAHDFNNLLMAISGSLQLLEIRIAQGKLTGIERYTGAAQESVRRAASLTQRLLAFSRRQTLDPKPTDVNKLLAGVEDLLRRTVGPEIALEVVGAGSLWSVKIDPPQLENAVLNLIINARDAMPDGGRITIETANKWLDDRAARDRELPPGQYISLCVTDTGTGMTPDVIAQAFDPFFTTKPLGQGTGLGLSMIHGFVRQSGGQVRVYSELGKGTTMCLYLPRYLGDSADKIAEAPPQEISDGGHGERVLVVDDEPLVRLFMVEVLEDAGYSILEAADGPSSLKILQSDARIDLLVTDVGLPGGMNGRQMADAARIWRPKLKVLFVTGYAENAVVGNGHLEVGMQVIGKPFDVAAFNQKVRAMLDS